MAQLAVGQKLRQALALHEQGRLAEAIVLYRAVIERDPHHPEALHLLGVAELQSGDTGRAVTLIEKAVSLDPANANYRSNFGLALMRLGRLEEALAQLDRALAINPNSANAFNHRGNILRELGRPDQALAAYARALAINPGHADALNNRGAALADLNRGNEAIASFNRCLAVDANHAGALCNRGALQVRLGQFDAALADLDRGVALEPHNPVARNNRGNALCGLGRYQEALTEFDAALSLNPDYADAWYNRGTARSELRQYEQALGDSDRALSLQPNRADAHVLRGHCLQKLHRWTEALAGYDAALRIKPTDAEVLAARAHLLSDLGRLEEALADYDRAYALDPKHELLRGWRVFCKLKMCAWRGTETESSGIEAAVKDGNPVCSPAVLLALSGDQALLASCARGHAQRHFPTPKTASPIPRARKERITLGYFSADFHEHATAYLTAGLFEHHDKSRFRIAAFSFGPAAEVAIRNRLKGAFDDFFDLSGMPDAEVVKLAHDCGVDIAIDMKGFTEGSRTGIFRQRAAPIQVSYLGYPGTMGADFIDYLIADDTIIPEAMSSYYTEEIVWLPDCYQPNDSTRNIPNGNFTREQFGLSRGGFVFCCFNNSYKIGSGIFDIWMRLLTRVEGSVLWLLEDNACAVSNLRSEAQRRGVDPARLIFAKRVSQAEHLARHRLADLCLDTLPYGAHTTASDALWAGCPLLTCIGTAFQGRVAASLLRAIGLPELITQSLTQYEAKALELALNPHKLRSLREELLANRNSCALFDTATYSRHLESAFLHMWDHYLSGRPPEGFHVSAAAGPH